MLREWERWIISHPSYVLDLLNLSRKNDIWAVGVVMFELIFGCTPFEEDSIPKTKSNIRKAKIVSDNEWNSLDDQGKDFFNKIFTKNYKQRVTPDDLLNHAWLQKE